MSDKAIEAALLPCPFCGGEAIVSRPSLTPKMWSISCRNCDAGPAASLSLTHATSTWNRRPTLTAYEAAKGGEPVAWRARRYGSSEWEVFGYDPRALRQFLFFEPLYSADALTSLVRERDAARQERDYLKSGVNAVVNCQSALTRAQVREAMDDLLVKGGWTAWGTENQSPIVERAEAAEARATAAEAERDALLQGVRDVDALVSARVAAAEADAARMREALEPFAAEANEWGDRWKDNFVPVLTPSVTDDGDNEKAAFTVGDLRRARNALGGKDE